MTRPDVDTCARDGHLYDSAEECSRCGIEWREIARGEAEAYARLDPEEKVRRFVAQGLIVPPDLVAIIMDRLDKRDGCHSREVELAQAAGGLLDAVDALDHDSAWLSATTLVMRAKLDATSHHGRR